MESCNEVLGIPYEYVLQIDGKVKAAYRRFSDALKAGLQLKELHPNSEVKVRDVVAQKTAEFNQGTK
jgi:hypothetical protein